MRLKPGCSCIKSYSAYRPDCSSELQAFVSDQSQIDAPDKMNIRSDKHSITNCPEKPKVGDLEVLSGTMVGAMLIADRFFGSKSSFAKASFIWLQKVKSPPAIPEKASASRSTSFGRKTLTFYLHQGNWIFFHSTQLIF